MWEILDWSPRILLAPFYLMLSLGIPRSIARTGRLKPCLQRGGLGRRLSTVSSILPDDIYDVVIVGGGIAGLALATRLRIGIYREYANGQSPRNALRVSNLPLLSVIV
jgi:hypothetical protein